MKRHTCPSALFQAEGLGLRDGFHTPFSTALRALRGKAASQINGTCLEQRGPHWRRCARSRRIARVDTNVPRLPTPLVKAWSRVSRVNSNRFSARVRSPGGVSSKDFAQLPDRSDLPPGAPVLPVKTTHMAWRTGDGNTIVESCWSQSPSTGSMHSSGVLSGRILMNTGSRNCSS